MRIGAASLLCLVASAPLSPVQGETAIAITGTYDGAVVRDIALRSEGGVDQLAAFTAVGIKVIPGDVIIAPGGIARSGLREGLTGTSILHLGSATGTDSFETEQQFTSFNSLGAIIDRDGTLIPGTGVTSLVSEDIGSGEKTLSTDAALLDGNYGIAVDEGTIAAPSTGTPSYDVIAVEVGYHGDLIVTVQNNGGAYRRVHLIKDGD